MMLHEWSSNQIQAKRLPLEIDRAINQFVCSCDCHVDDSNAPSQHDAKLLKLDLGRVSVIQFFGAGTQTIRRTHKHLEHDQADDLLFYLPLTANYLIDQSGHHLQLSPGQSALVRLNHPLQGTFVSPHNTLGTAIHIKISKTALLERAPLVDECLYKQIPVHIGTGRILLTTLSSIYKEAQHLRAHSAYQLGESLIDLFAALVGDTLSIQNRFDGQPKTRSKELTRQSIVETINANLTNPDLSPAFIAQKCRISLRSLHMAFEDSGSTVSALIREQRLLHCRQDLRSPEVIHRSVSEIAYRWGFKDLAHFNRAYKSRFGSPPGKDRRG